jgi:hypothetical protein
MGRPTSPGCSCVQATITYQRSHTVQCRTLTLLFVCASACAPPPPSWSRHVRLHEMLCVHPAVCGLQRRGLLNRAVLPNQLLHGQLSPGLRTVHCSQTLWVLFAGLHHTSCMHALRSYECSCSHDPLSRGLLCCILQIGVRNPIDKTMEWHRCPPQGGFISVAGYVAM